MKDKRRICCIVFLASLFFAAVFIPDIAKADAGNENNELSAGISSDENMKEIPVSQSYDKDEGIFTEAADETEKVSVTLPVTSTSVSLTVSGLVTSVTTVPAASVSVTETEITTAVSETALPETEAPETEPEYTEPEPSPQDPDPDPVPEPEPDPPSEPPQYQFPSASEFQSEVLRLVNQKRSEAGVPALSGSDGLNYCAQIRADEITVDFSHYRPDGSDCFSVFNQYGLNVTSASAENIAAGSSTPAEVVEQWMNSDSHRKNMLNPAYRAMGVGYSRYDDEFENYWVQLFIS